MNLVADFREEFQAGLEAAELSRMTGITALWLARQFAMAVDYECRRTQYGGAFDKSRSAQAREQLLQAGYQKFGYYPQIMDASMINQLESHALLEALTVEIAHVGSWAELIGDESQLPTSPGQRPREQLFW